MKVEFTRTVFMGAEYVKAGVVKTVTTEQAADLFIARRARPHGVRADQAADVVNKTIERAYA
jgi:hypothetical protein